MFFSHAVKSKTMDRATFAIVLNAITLAIVVCLLCKCRTKEMFAPGRSGTIDVPEGKRIMITDASGGMDSFDVSKLKAALKALDDKINTKAAADHHHDGRYYTESESNTRYHTKSQADGRFVQKAGPFKIVTQNFKKNHNDQSFTDFCVTDNGSDRNAGGQTTDGMRLEQNMGKCLTFKVAA